MTAPQRPTPRVEMWAAARGINFADPDWCMYLTGDDASSAINQAMALEHALSEREEECKALAELNKALDAQLAEMEAALSAVDRRNDG